MNAELRLDGGYEGMIATSYHWICLADCRMSHVSAVYAKPSRLTEDDQSATAETASKFSSSAGTVHVLYMHQ